MPSDADASAKTPTVLSEYLLAEKTGRLILIDCDPAHLSWPDGMSNIVRSESLEDALNLQPHSAAQTDAGNSTDVAVLQLRDGQKSHDISLGQAVRAFPHRLIVYTHDDQAPDALFFSFGFRKLNVEERSELCQTNRWYEFRLSHYKLPPDWLNARFWAHPERFDLHESDANNVDSEFEDEEE